MLIGNIENNCYFNLNIFKKTYETLLFFLNTNIFIKKFIKYSHELK